MASSGFDLLKSLYWCPELQLAVEKGVYIILASSGITVAEALLMTFSGYMASKNKQVIQRQFTRSSKTASIPEWGAGRQRTAPNVGSQSGSGSSCSITRLLV